jgi:hypothetical protein
VPRHVARLVTRLVVDYFASRRLVVDYFPYATRPGRVARRRLLHLCRASGCCGTSRGLSRDSSSTIPTRAGSSSSTSPTPCVRVLRHVTRLVVNYSVRRDFVLRPHWLYFSHAMRRDYLSRSNSGSTSTTPCTAVTSSFGRIASTIHLD